MTPSKHEKTHFSLDEGEIDHENLRLYNVIGMETGVALGHNVIADVRTLEMAADLGNSNNAKASDYAANRVSAQRTGKEVSKRVRQRFGHPAMSSDGTGRTIGSLHNFRVENGRLLHDTQFYQAARLSPAFSGDVIDYIFSLAEEAPESLNESAVVDAALVWTFEDGTETELSDDDYDRAAWGEATPPEGAITDFPILRPFSLHHIDLVSDGALTDSLFDTQADAEKFFSAAFNGHSSAYGSELFELMDRFREEFGLSLTEIETKGIEIITRYVYSRRNHMHDTEGEQVMARNKDRPNVSKMAHEQAGGGGAIETVEDSTDAAIVSVEETTVVEVSEVEDEMVIEDSAEVADATIEDEADVDDELDEIEAIMAETEADEADDEPIETIQALTIVQDTVMELSGIVERQNTRIEKITTLLLQQATQLQAISRNLRRLDGERIVTERVPLAPRQDEDALEPMMPNQQPEFVPPLHGYAGERAGRVGLRQFSSVIDGDTPDLVLASDSPSAVAEKAVERRVKRNRQYRMGTRGHVSKK